ncbi:transmembrane and ubiquitin-like domain-containing protein 1 [Spea bombifrons]|uniref:transmembrane and ubiquitin-like domain-containing protein 1 n=1 Tax=Spea bombifrons TaxID=233779 RepID=UPI00234B5EEE|nr:transmembrane and ubiquitin-like domain-containing protein 1 [Spea bombifrons]
MALIEGVGDEVTLLFAVVILLTVLALAWVSTHTTDRLPTHWGPSVSDPGGTSLNSHPTHPRTDPSQSNGEPSPASDPAQSNGEPSPASDPAQSNREPSPASDPTKSNREPSPASDPTKSNRNTLPASDPTQSNTECSPSSDPTEGNREPSPASDLTQSNREPSPASDPSKSPSAIRETRYDNEPILSNDDSLPNTLRHRGPPNGPERAPSEVAGTIVLRLKFLNDTERLLTVRPSDTVLHIKQTYFPGQEDRVRLIYQGQLLRDDSQTVSALQLRDGCVLHCHISQHASGQGPRGPELVPVPLNIGSLLVPLLGLILMLLWYYKLQYPYAFTATATACLGGVTLLVGVMAFSSYRREF